MRIDKYIIYAILAAVLYAFSTPISKLLLINLSPIYIAALLYLGAGIGMGLVALIRKKIKVTSYKPFTKQELPAILLMVILDIIAPI
jgi:drug/metabolite transporter (DMT)-like permease